MIYEIREIDTDEKLGASDALEAAVSLALMLATEPVRQGRTWSSRIVDPDDGLTLATFYARVQA